MRPLKLFFATSTILAAFLFIYFTLSGEKSLVAHPKGLIAHQEWHLIKTNVLLMLSILVPTAIVLLVVAWRYQSHRQRRFNPEKKYGPLSQLVLWTLPTIVVAIMAYINWKATHALDPYKPLQGKPLKIQVVAIDWKWLFIYPEQQVATLNFVQFPKETPIHFELAADGSPMNSFWIPELSGQIYCMAGMITPLHIIADGIGEYSGKAAEINGEGYAKMRFTAKSTTNEDFESWVQEVKSAPQTLDQKTYDELLKPTIISETIFYSSVEKDLFNDIIMKFMHPHHHHK